MREFRARNVILGYIAIAMVYEVRLPREREKAYKEQ